jgi:N-acetylglutamate synthase
VTEQVNRRGEAERLHEALCGAFELLSSVLEEARFERRDGYAWLVNPPIPIPQFNGVWADDDVAAGKLEDALGEIAHMGLPYSVQTRPGRTPVIEQEARRLGLTAQEPTPGMVAAAGELREPPATDAEIVRVATADGLAQALAVAADGFGAPPEIFAPLYFLEMAALEGMAFYLARVGEQDVSTALACTLERTVGIFNVATPPEHRGRGYGAAITTAAVRDGFSAGADLAWLQSSSSGFSVYRRLGFREVETYVLYTAPEAPVI